MLSEFFVRCSALRRSGQAGPLGPYVEDVVSVLKKDGYSHETLLQKIHTIHRLSSWMRRRNLRVTALCEERLVEFLSPRERERDSAPTVRFLLEHLRRSGLASVRRTPGRLTPCELVEQRFSDYLA